MGCMRWRSRRMHLTSKQAETSIALRVQLAREERVNRFRWDVAGNERFADTTNENKGQLTVPHLLVLPHDLDERRGVRCFVARNIGNSRRQAGGPQVCDDAVYGCVVGQSELLAKLK